MYYSLCLNTGVTEGNVRFTFHTVCPFYILAYSQPVPHIFRLLPRMPVIAVCLTFWHTPSTLRIFFACLPRMPLIAVCLTFWHTPSTLRILPVCLPRALRVGQVVNKAYLQFIRFKEGEFI